MAAISRAVLGVRAGLPEPLTLHNFYVPAGCLIFRYPQLNPKFVRPQARLPGRDVARRRPCCRRCTSAPSWSATHVATPLEHDVWSHSEMLRVVSHTPDRMRASHRGASIAVGVDGSCSRVPDRQLYTLVELPRADWETATKCRRLVTSGWRGASDRLADIAVSQNAGATRRPCDHLPVTPRLS